MTVLHVELTVPAKDGTVRPASGTLRFAPSKRRAVEGAFILPIPFQVSIVDGIADVTLGPSEPGWAWRISEHVHGLPSRTIYATISGATQNYTDLVPLDPATLDPTAEPTAAWAERITELEAALAAIPEPSPAITPDPDDPGFFLIGA